MRERWRGTGVPPGSYGTAARGSGRGAGPLRVENHWGVRKTSQLQCLLSFGFVEKEKKEVECFSPCFHLLKD